MLGQAALSLSDKCSAWEASAGPAPAQTISAWAVRGSRRRRAEQHPLSWAGGLRLLLSPVHTPDKRSQPWCKPYSVKYLQLCFPSWSLPWICQKDEHHHLDECFPRGQQTPRGRCVFVSDKVLARPGETTGRGVRAPWLRGKGEKQIRFSTFQSSLPDAGCDSLASHRY